jgi:hypothetical protein
VRERMIVAVITGALEIIAKMKAGKNPAMLVET